MGTNRTTVIGDITVRNTLEGGIYANEVIPTDVSPASSVYYDPKTDKALYRNYTYRSFDRKRENKLALQE